MQFRKVVVLLLALTSISASAVPAITGVSPQQGFSFGPTRVTITGIGFTGGALQVLFGDVAATILEATPTSIRVLANPAPNGEAGEERSVDVIVRVEGMGESVFRSFSFEEYAWPGPENYTPVIVPLTARTFEGANGSYWTSELRVFNASPHLLRMPGQEGFSIEPPFDPAVAIDPHHTERVSLYNGDTTRDGAVLYVPKPLANAPKFSLRVVDLSRNATNLGVDIPVFKESDAADEVTLADVPTDARYRATLRIYGWIPGPMPVRVSVYPEDGDTAIAQYEVDLQGIVNVVDEPFPPYPSYAAFDPLTPAVRAAGERVRIAVSNGTTEESPTVLPKISAFLSLTNNETQQVTIVRGQ